MEILTNFIHFPHNLGKDEHLITYRVNYIYLEDFVVKYLIKFFKFRANKILLENNRNSVLYPNLSIHVRKFEFCVKKIKINKNKAKKILHQVDMGIQLMYIIINYIFLEDVNNIINHQK